MPGQNIQALGTLRLELKFVELGLYRAYTAGHPVSVFEDSPACLGREASSCRNCALMRFVPHEYRHETVPCHHIPLTVANETVDSFYRTGTQEELEQALRDWLSATIKKLEEEENQSRTIDALPVA